MMSDDTLSRMLLQWLMYAGPSMLAYVIGMVIASTQLTRYPKPAILALVGCLVHAFASCTTLLLRLVFEWGGTFGPQIGSISTAVTMGGVLLHVVGFGLLFAAVFVGRRVPTPPEMESI